MRTTYPSCHFASSVPILPLSCSFQNKPTKLYAPTHYIYSYLKRFPSTTLTFSYSHLFHSFPSLFSCLEILVWKVVGKWFQMAAWHLKIQSPRYRRLWSVLHHPRRWWLVLERGGNHQRTATFNRPISNLSLLCLLEERLWGAVDRWIDRYIYVLSFPLLE